MELNRIAREAAYGGYIDIVNNLSRGVRLSEQSSNEMIQRGADNYNRIATPASLPRFS